MIVVCFVDLFLILIQVKVETVKTIEAVFDFLPVLFGMNWNHSFLENI